MECNKCKKILKESDFYCYQCKIKLCKECINEHKIKFSSHKLILLKNVSSKLKENYNKKSQNLDKSEDKNNDLKIENLNKDKACSCIMCKIPHSKYPSRFYYTCTDCNNYICSLCQKNHDTKYYSHILVNPHKYGEEFRKINKGKVVHRRFASVGAEKTIRDKKGDKNKNRNESVKLANIYGKTSNK